MNYTYESIDQILRACEDHDCSFAEVILRSEMETYECSADSIYRGIDERLRIFEESIQEGLKNRDKTISGMSGGHGAQLLGHRPLLLGDLAYKAMTYAILVNEANAKMEIEALPSKSPRMYLNTYETTVKAGSELDKISYIKEITDDADSQKTLFAEIQVDGEVDTATPGDYTLTYHVTDSNGNQSNMAVLTVHVQ